MLQVTFGDGKNCEDFVYVENVVHGHLCANKTLATIEGARTSGGKVCSYCRMETHISSISHYIMTYI